MLYNPKQDKPTTPEQLLRRAADLIELRGHAKGVFLMEKRHQASASPGMSGEVGSMCIQGALMAATGLEDKDLHWGSMCINPLIKETMNILKEKVFPVSPSYSPVVDWNNRKSTTQGMVVEVMRLVAEQLEIVKESELV